MEKEALLRDAAVSGGHPNGATAFSTMNTSIANQLTANKHNNTSVDIGQMSLRELRKEDQAMLEDLQDQVRTKEEEIQILWNVVKEINKLKGGSMGNIQQLQKMFNTCALEAAAQAKDSSFHERNKSDSLHHMYATPGHTNYTSRY